MAELISKLCGVCGYTQKHKQIIVAGMILWQCQFCHSDSPWRGQPPVPEKEPAKT
jgi:hypothetical protein